ncbi:MAG TPA: hypothetical protein VM598_14880 [Bdellovibrionota bacterium]|nr:hypothetical protein [Bdellovibrionota bacterium]
MSSRALACILALAFALASCGKFGEKDASRGLYDYNPSAIGCLNDIGPRVKRYASGEIGEAEWASTCDCAIDSLAQFKKFIRGSGPYGASYTQADIAGFLANFLMTSYPDNSKLVSSGFDLKAALLGGSRDLATQADIDALIRILKSVKSESLKLLPLLKKRAARPTREDLMALADQVALSGANLARELGQGSSSVFTWQSARTLADELSRASGLPLPERFIDWASAGKQLIFAGEEGGVAGGEIARVVELGAQYLGPALAALSVRDASLVGPGATNLAYLELARKARPALERTLTLHRGAISLAGFDRLVEALPASAITVDLTILERTLRPIVNRLLRSDTPDAFDGNVLQTLYSVGEDLVESQRIVDEVYTATHELLPEEFVRAANRLGSSDPATLKRVSRLTFLAQYFKPLFEQGDDQVRFVRLRKLSQTDMSRVLWIRILVEELMESYSTAAARDRVSLDDFKRVIDDYQDLGFTLHLIDNSIPDAYARRFREGNLFTLSSNGDAHLDMNEATYYIAYFFSGKMLSSRLLDTLAGSCERQGLDPLEFHWVKASCFRQVFFGNYRRWWDHFPDLIAYYESLNSVARQEFQVALEAGSRRFGHGEELFASYDADAVTGLIHFMEGMYVRYDRNLDQVLDLSEALIAYPVFKNELAKIAGIDPSDNDTLEAVFTYILKYKEPPQKGIIGAAKLIIWKLQRSSWSISADRGTIYTVMASLATSPP